MPKKTLNKYRIYCQTERAFKTVWQDICPTSCPDNNSHMIDNGSVTITDVLSTNAVTVQNYVANTGGNYRIEGFNVPIPPQQDVTFSTSKPMDILCYSMYLYPTDSNIHDTVSLYTQFSVPISAVIKQGDSNIPVTSSIVSTLRQMNFVTPKDVTPGHFHFARNVWKVSPWENSFYTPCRLSSRYTMGSLPSLRPHLPGVPDSLLVALNKFFFRLFFRFCQAIYSGHVFFLGSWDVAMSRIEECL
jgi:hypothetical protein